MLSKNAIIFLKILLIFIILSCNTKKTELYFKLNGAIAKDHFPEFIIIEYNGIKDTAEIRNNQFLFKGKIDSPSKAFLSVPPASTVNRPFYIENVNMNLFISIEKKKYKGIDLNFINIDSVLGTKTALIKNDFDKFKELNKNSKNWSEKLYDKLYNLIIDNSDNQYMGDLLAYYSNDTILDNNKLLTLYNKLDHNEQSLWSLEKIKKTIFPDSIAKIGNKFTDFSLVDTEGNTRNTNEFNGSIFLIDFWASWCAPCRKQNPEFINIYNEFHDKGFEILGVSIDTDKRKWIKAVKTDKLPWLNLIDKRGIKSPILIKYDAALGIPKNWLIDQNSKILESDLSPNELRSYLKQNL